jgi:hypothetical protein
MESQIVSYVVGESTVVRFEIEPPPGFEAAGVGEVVGRVRDAIGPAVEAARTVLEHVRAVSPDEIEVKFGLKVSGKADWLVARAAAEGNFEITLRWSPDDDGEAVAGYGQD